MRHLSKEELEDGLDHILDSPADDGVLEMVIRRPDVDQREILEVAELTFDGIHPNASGYEIVVENVLETLRPLL